MLNKHNDNITRNLYVIVTGERTKHKGKKAKVNYIRHFSRTVDLSVEDIKEEVTLSINSVRPLDKVKEIKNSEPLYVAYCVNRNMIISYPRNKKETDETAKEAINSGKSEEVIIFKASERKTKKIVTEKL